MSRAATTAAGALALLAACGTPAEEFSAEYPEAVCAWVQDCSFGGATGSEEACIAAVEAGLDEGEGDAACTYKPRQATQCLAALEAGCDERVAVYYECKRVYRGEDCPIELSASLSSTGD